MIYKIRFFDLLASCPSDDEQSASTSKLRARGKACELKNQPSIGGFYRYRAQGLWRCRKKLTPDSLETAPRVTTTDGDDPFVCDFRNYPFHFCCAELDEQLYDLEVYFMPSLWTEAYAVLYLTKDVYGFMEDCVPGK